MLPAFLRSRYESYRRSADEAIRSARVEATAKTRNKYFTSWCFYLQPYGADPFLGESTTYTERIHHITAFGAMVRAGELGRGNQIKVGSVRAAINAVASTIALERGETPLHNEGGDYHLAIRQMFDGWAKEDPPVEKKLAVGVDLPEEACARGRRSKKAKLMAIGDWILIAFYFLLRIGEYTMKATRNDTKQTVQFRMKDVAFFGKTDGRLSLLPLNASDEEIMEADGATLRLGNQKNGYKNACIHQEHNGHDYFCPVRAIGRRYCHIRQHTKNPDTYLSAYFEKGKRRDLTDNDIRKEIKVCAIALDYKTRRGIPVTRIDTHSLRGGGAMALHLSGYSDREIQKMGRWTSDTFKEYISEQLNLFTKGMSKAMSQRFNFVNVEGGVLRDVTNTCMAN